MEYTRSVGEYYEAFEGKPRDIAKLIKVLDKESCKSPNTSKGGEQ